MMTTKDITLNAKLVILAIERGTFDITPEELTLYNLFILTTKWILWKHRNNVKHDLAKKQQIFLLSRNVLFACKKNIKLILQSNRKEFLSNNRIQILQNALLYNVS